jgi:hypothetical protein
MREPFSGARGDSDAQNRMRTLQTYATTALRIGKHAVVYRCGACNHAFDREALGMSQP